MIVTPLALLAAFCGASGATVTWSSSAASLFAGNPRDRSLDSDWRFLRADAPGAENPAFDDSKWRKLDVPHDWSIEDLPPKENPVPELAAVAGQWRFHPGDDAGWKARELDDSKWQRQPERSGQLPSTCAQNFPGPLSGDSAPARRAGNNQASGDGERLASSGGHRSDGHTPRTVTPPKTVPVHLT